MEIKPEPFLQIIEDEIIAGVEENNNEQKKMFLEIIDEPAEETGNKKNN